MKIPIFMIFQFFGIISAWAVKALEDGKVTAAEGLELVVSLASILGVEPEFDMSDYMPEAIDIRPAEPEKDFLSKNLKTSDHPVPEI